MQSIMRTIADDSRIIRLPVHVHDKNAKLLRARRLYEKNHSEEPSISDLAEISGLSNKEISRLIHWTKPEISFEDLELCEDNLMRNYLSTNYNNEFLPCDNCPFFQDEIFSLDDSMRDNLEPPLCLEQFNFENDLSKSERVNKILREIADNSIGDELNSVQTENLRISIKEELGSLSPRYGTVIELRYGLRNGESLTLEELGQKFGVTRERIRQMETSALDTLRRSRILKNYQDEKKIGSRRKVIA